MELPLAVVIGEPIMFWQPRGAMSLGLNDITGNSGLSEGRNRGSYFACCLAGTRLPACAHPWKKKWTVFLPDCPELQAQGGLFLLVRMDAPASLPERRADREGCGRLLGGGPEQL